MFLRLMFILMFVLALRFMFIECKWFREPDYRIHCKTIDSVPFAIVMYVLEDLI